MKIPRALICIAITIFSVCSTVTAEEQSTKPELFLCAGVDWMFGARVGVEYLPLERFGIRADAGATLFGGLTADLMAVWHLLPRQSAFQLNLLAGVPNAAAPLTFAGAMLSLGMSLEARYFFSRRFGIGLRLGEGFPFFFEPGKPVTRDLRYPLGLWPDAVLSAVWRLGG